MKTIMEVIRQDDGSVTFSGESGENITAALARHILTELLNGNREPFDTLYSVTVNVLSLWPDESLYEKYMESIRENVTEGRKMHRERIENAFNSKQNTN